MFSVRMIICEAQQLQANQAIEKHTIPVGLNILTLRDPRWDMGDILNDPMFDCLDELLDRPNLLSLLSRS
jgi:hypothetical protein